MKHTYFISEYINIKKYLFLVLSFTIFFGCEDVIDVDVPTANPKLVIEASLNWFDGTSGNEQDIKLSLTAPFFGNDIPPANGATVTVTNSSGNIFSFIEDGATGIYKTTTFVPVLNERYTLTINYNNNTYSATETLKTTVPFDFVEQKDDGGFTGEEIEIKAFFTDPVDEENYYFFELDSPTEISPVIDAAEDEFFDGNQIFAFYSSEDLEPGDELNIKILGSSKQFYEYIFLLLQQGEPDGGPFQTQPATVRGNCKNDTNPDDFPLGFFRVSQAYELVYTVE